MLARIIDKNTIEVYDLTQFDTDAIMHSGQVFRYFQRDGGYCVVVGSNYAFITTHCDKVIIKCNDSSLFFDYFDLAVDYNEIKAQLYEIDGLRPAIKAGGGIRILRSDFFEMVISFIISANNNIKRFTKTLNLICQNHGQRLKNGEYSFPSIDSLKCLTEQDYKSYGCGYRSAYLVKAVEQLRKIDYKALEAMNDVDLAKKLTSISGVGPKVSACIMLFSTLHRLSVCPVDTWIKKALEKLSKEQQAMLLTHSYAGVAQQYLFYYYQYLKK